MAVTGFLVGAGIPALYGAFSLISGSAGTRREDRRIGYGFNREAYGQAYQTKMAGAVALCLLTPLGGVLGHKVQDLYSASTGFESNQGNNSSSSNCSLYNPENCFD